MERLPYGVGRWSTGWYLLLAMLLSLIGLGAYAYSRQFVEGLIMTGMRDVGTMGGSTWGLYITFDVYFVGISFAGITVAALIRLLNLKHLKPVSRMAELLTVISLILAGLSVLADLGQPLRGIVNLFRYARPQSPFFGTFTLVIAGYLFASLVYFFLDGRRDAALCAQVPGRLQWFYRLWASGYRDTPAERERHERASFWLAIAILPLLVTAHSTLGFVFGLQVGRPGWFSALQAPGFVIMAGVSGVGMLLVIAALLRRVLGAEDQIGPEIFQWLSQFLMILILIYLYFMIVEWLTNMYAAPHHEVRITEALLTGVYAVPFWGVVATLLVACGVLVWPHVPLPAGLPLPAFRPNFARATGLAAIAVAVVLLIQTPPTVIQTGVTLAPGLARWLPWLLAILLLLFAISILPLLRTNIIAGAVVSGVLVNLAAMGKRYLIVVPSQTHGTLLPYPAGFYTPTWVEYSIVVGLLALGTFLYVAFVKIFPIVEVPTPAEEGLRPRDMEAAVRRLPAGHPEAPKRLQPRATLAILMVIVGFALQGVSYFKLAAPWGIPNSPVFSNPRLPFAPTLFILGVMVVFLAAVVYELLPEKE
jgi:Ni/Fe-hydrogenase subunit HybB-like protein